MASFVLVSGAWHAGWCWERVKPLLEASGHKVVAPDLLGMGPESTPTSEVTLGDWADQVAAIIREQQEAVILVGHSRGGIVISETAERAFDRIDRLVYLAAFLLTDGTTISQAYARVRHDRKGDDVLEVRPDQTAVIKPGALRATFYNTTPEEWATRAAAQITPEPLSALNTAVHVTDERYGSIPRAYIECLHDRAVPIELQRAFQADLPCDPVITLETDHSPFYSAPESLTAALEEIARTSA